MNIALVVGVISASAALIGSLLGSVLMPLVKEQMAKSRDARYLAIRVVCILDKYVEDCAMTATDSGRKDEKGATVAEVSAPSQPCYPTDVNWKSIDSAMMYKLLSLPAAAERAPAYVQGAADNCVGPFNTEFFEERTRQYATLGLQAHSLANTLRKKYAIHDVENRSWDPVEQMRDELEQLKHQEAAREAEWDRRGGKGMPPVPIPKPPKPSF